MRHGVLAQLDLLLKIWKDYGLQERVFWLPKVRNEKDASLHLPALGTQLTVCLRARLITLA